MAETTSREFIEWLEFLDKEEWSHNSRQDYYMAQIALEAARGRVQHPASLHIEDFLLKFLTRGKKATPVSQEVLNERAEFSKMKWFGLCGLGADGSLEAPVKPGAAPAKRPPGRKRAHGGDNTRT